MVETVRHYHLWLFLFKIVELRATILSMMLISSYVTNMDFSTLLDLGVSSHCTLAQRAYKCRLMNFCIVDHRTLT